MYIAYLELGSKRSPYFSKKISCINQKTLIIRSKFRSNLDKPDRDKT